MRKNGAHQARLPSHHLQAVQQTRTHGAGVRGGRGATAGPAADAAESTAGRGAPMGGGHGTTGRGMGTGAAAATMTGRQEGGRAAGETPFWPGSKQQRQQDEWRRGERRADRGRQGGEDHRRSLTTIPAGPGRAQHGGGGVRIATTIPTRVNIPQQHGGGAQIATTIPTCVSIPQQRSGGVWAATTIPTRGGIPQHRSGGGGHGVVDRCGDIQARGHTGGKRRRRTPVGRYGGWRGGGRPNSSQSDHRPAAPARHRRRAQGGAISRQAAHRPWALARPAA